MPSDKKDILLILSGAALFCVSAATLFVSQQSAVPTTMSNRTPEAIEWRPAGILPKTYAVSQSYTWYSLHGDGIYCMFDDRLPEADVPTFVASSLDAYGKDKNHVYFCNQIISEADPATFTILSKEYAKDAHHVYFAGGTIIPGADPATFMPVSAKGVPDPLQTGYGKDSRHVYSMDHEVAGADPATFVIIPPLIPKDKNFIYQSERVLGPASLITDNAEFAKSLPAKCNPAGAEVIEPRLYPSAFSADGSVVGYANYSRLCVIDKNAHTIQNFPYGEDASVSLSKDGSKVLFSVYQKGEGGDIPPCPDCGRFSLDRKTEKVERLPVSQQQ